MLDVTKALTHEGVTEPAVIVGPAGSALDQDQGISLTLISVSLPVQFTGTVDGYPVNFQAHWANWDLTFARTDDSASRPQHGALLRLQGFYDPSGKGRGAGRMPLPVACTLLWAGVLALRLDVLRRHAEGEDDL